MIDNTHRGPHIEPVDDGPLRYRRGDEAENRGTLQGPDRTEIQIRDSALLCRCGASDRRPFCDGSHLSVGFSSEKKWKPGAGRLVDHVGTRVTIHDNRALCAHVEYCVQELPSVFDRSKRPWIDPDGASVEEIVALCRKCPSGALSCTVDGVLYRNHDDRPPTVIASREGPYFVEGGVEIVGEERSEGASSEHCTLCRCGESRNKPLCDGKHWDVGFTNRAD
jgi:CDGSH-type Zn-finger protein